MDDEKNNFLLDKSDDELFKILEDVIGILNTTNDYSLKSKNQILLNKMIDYKIKKVSLINELKKKYDKLTSDELSNLINEFDVDKEIIIRNYNEINNNKSNSFN